MYQKYLPKYLRKSLLKYLREICLQERKMFLRTKFEESFSANVFVHNKAESSWMPIFTCLLSKFFTQKTPFTVRQIRGQFQKDLDSQNV